MYINDSYQIHNSVSSSEGVNELGKDSEVTLITFIILFL